MGKSFDNARAAGQDPQLLDALEQMKDQLLVVLIKRLGGAVVIPVAEIDDTGGVRMDMVFDQEARTITFEVKPGRAS